MTVPAQGWVDDGGVVVVVVVEVVEVVEVVDVVVEEVVDVVVLEVVASVVDVSGWVVLDDAFVGGVVGSEPTGGAPPVVLDGMHSAGPGHHHPCHRPRTFVRKQSSAFAGLVSAAGSAGTHSADGPRTRSVRRSPICTASGVVNRTASSDG
jgi:hypothetical protein